MTKTSSEKTAWMHRVFFQLTQRYPLQNCVFSLNNTLFCLVRYYTTCNVKHYQTFRFRFRLYTTHSNGVMINSFLNLRSLFFQTVSSRGVKYFTLNVCVDFMRISFVIHSVNPYVAHIQTHLGYSSWWHKQNPILNQYVHMSYLR